MTKHLRRFGAWVGSAAILVSTFFTPFASLAAAQSDSTDTFNLHVASDILINELLPDPISGNEFIELVNLSANPIDISGWTLRDESGTDADVTFPASTTVAAGGYLVHELTSALLNNAGDTVTLKDNSDTIRDQISYGSRLTDQIIASIDGETIGRITDGGTWYSGLVATPDTSNTTANLAVPSSPLAASVKASEVNPENFINIASKSAVVVSLSVGVNSLATDLLTAQLIDHNGALKSDSVTAIDGLGTVTTDTPISTATFIDGDVAVRAYATNSLGISTTYSSGAPAIRDTIAPSKPLSVTIPVGAQNSADYISSGNVANVATEVDLPDSSLSTDTILVEVTDGTTTAATTTLAISGGAVQTVTDLNATNLDQGIVTLRATLIDAAGNTSSVETNTTIVKDTLAPTGTLIVNNGASVTASNAITLALAATDTISSVTQMRLANTNDFVGSSWENFATSQNWNLTAGEGPRTVFVQFKDSASNISTIISHSILVETDASNINLYALATGENTVKQLPIEVTVTATSPTVLTLAQFDTNPGTAAPVGATSLGRYYEAGLTDTSKITFPVLVKLYYTTADLAAAGITSENQLRGLAYFDQASQTWKYFSSTGVVTEDIALADPNNEGATIQYAGYFYANADHLTPITGLADTTPPTTPSLTATAGDKFVDLSWNVISDAADYIIRYRAVGDSNSGYFQVIVNSTTNAARVTNLENGREYEFGIAARDATGNISAFAKQLATPTVPVATATLVTAPIITTPVVTGPTKGGLDLSQNYENETTIKSSETPNSTATSPEPENDSRDLSRLLITLAILIIAIGAGTAGYYGYQWWALRDTSVAPTTPPVVITSTNSAPVSQTPIAPVITQTAAPVTPEPVQTPPTPAPESSTHQSPPDEPSNPPTNPSGRW